MFEGEIDCDNVLILRALSFLLAQADVNCESDWKTREALDAEIKQRLSMEPLGPR